MTALEKELIAESHRWGDGNYVGIVFVHPDDVLETTHTIVKLCEDKRAKLPRGIIKFDNGAKMMVHTFEDKRSRVFEYNYAGFEFTSILLHSEAFGKYINGEWVCVNTNIQNPYNGFLGYMMSRLRSQSIHHSRLVFV